MLGLLHRYISHLVQQVKTNLFRNNSHSSVHLSGPKTHINTMLLVRSGYDYLNEMIHREFRNRNYDLAKRCRVLWRQWEKNSDLRFKLASSGLNIMRYFSILQSWQKFLRGLKAPLVLFKILHSTLAAGKWTCYVICV